MKEDGSWGASEALPEGGGGSTPGSSTSPAALKKTHPGIPAAAVAHGNGTAADSGGLTGVVQRANGGSGFANAPPQRQETVSGRPFEG